MDLHTLSQKIQRLQEEVSATQPGDERQRQKLLAMSQDLVADIETPSERIARMCYPDIYSLITTRVLIDLNVFRLISNEQAPVTIARLANKTGADPVLLGRLLKFVCTQGYVQEVSPDEYAASSLTKKIATPEGQGVIVDMCWMYRVGSELPKFLKERQYQNPTDKDDSPWKFGMRTTDHYFEWVNRPGREFEADALHNHMRFKTLGLKWHEMPNIMQHVFGDQQASNEDALIVDIGGSSGHDLVSFKSGHPNMRGRLILQDLPETVEAAKAAGELTSNGIEAYGHDFFTPQDIHGARVYYLKMVLHDWPDEQCKQILANLKPALKQGHSRILLNEIIIPEVGAGWFETSVDMIMLCAHSAQERREKHWRTLIESVDGLKITNIWNVDGAVEKIIEVVLT